MNMEAEKALRYAIILQWLLLIIALVAGMVEESHLPNTMKWWLRRNETDDFTRWDTLRLFVDMAFYLGYAIASIGVYHSKAWARKAYTVFTCVTLIVILINTPSFTPVANALEYGSYLAVGFILALMYFSSLRMNFQKSYW